MRSGNDPIRYKPVKFCRGRRRSIDGMPIAHIELHQFAVTEFFHFSILPHGAGKSGTIKLKKFGDIV
jgi:hypothetical protein